MTKKDVLNLRNNSIVKHNRYGVCRVKEIMFDGTDIFGLVLIPEAEKGRALLTKDSGIGIDTFLEDSYRKLSVPECIR